MRTSKICLLVAIISGLLAMPMIANAAWTTLDGQAVGEGIDYQQFSSGGCTVHVTRMPIGDDNYAIQACSARQSVNYPQESGGETGYGERIQDQLDWYDTSMNNYGFLSGDQWISWWQSTSNVIAAINGGPHNNGASYGVTKGHMESGCYDTPIPDLSGLTGFIWSGLRLPVIGGCLGHDDTPTIYYGEYSSAVARINDGTAEGNEMVVFTPRQKGFKTPARSTAGKEILVRQPERYMLSTGNTSTCYLWAVGNDYGETWIPFDCIVLSGSGTEATKLAAFASAGYTVTCVTPVTNYFTEEQDPGYGCVSTDTSVDWNDVFAYAGGTWRFLEDDTVLPNPSDTNADYRTAVAYNENYVYFVVVEAPGMDMQALGNFCKNTADIDATEGIALDGAANSQMVVNDSLISTNTSAYSTFGTYDSPVADGLMMVKILQKDISPRKYDWIDATVQTVESCDMRLGPGNNYPVIQTIPSDATVTIKFHPKNRYKSTGKYWAYVEYNGIPGFIWDDCLEECVVLWGGDCTVVKTEGENTAFGFWLLGNVENLRWQKLVDDEWVDLELSAGHISLDYWGQLEFTNLQLSDTGEYRCVSDCCTIPTTRLEVYPDMTSWTPLDGESVGDGIDYREFEYDGNPVYVTRMPVNDEDYGIEACSARKAVNYGNDDGEGQTILQQTQYYADQPNSYGFYTTAYGPWGRRPTIYAAINGGPFNSGTATGLEVTQGHIQQSFYANRMPELGGLTGIFWGMDKLPHIGGCVDHGAQTATYGAYTTAIASVNSGTAESDELVMFTSQNPGSRTPARGTSGKEIAVRSYYPYGFNTGNTSTGEVYFIGEDDGETWIPFDSVVLSGSGTIATQLATLSVGDTVTIDQNITNKYTEEQDPGYGCVNTDTSVPWDEAYAYVGGTWRFLEDDVVLPDASDTTETYRTAVAYNSNYVYFVTAESMNAEDMGNFCKDNSAIDATDGILLDGGTSTQMVVEDRQIIWNSLAYSTYDSWQAPVADGLMMTKQNAKSFSCNPFPMNYPVDTLIDTFLRTGPGDSYPIICEVEAEETVTAKSHPKNGVLSSNCHWQCVEYDGDRGWIEEEALDCCYHCFEPESRSADLYEEGVPFGTCFGGQITSRQWYKYVSGDWVAVNNDTGHIHGADTDCLVFDVVLAGDDGTYRAKATGACGDEEYCDSCTLTIE